MDGFRGAQETATGNLATPQTDAARFTITKLDVGTEAVRPGLMADIELERAVLLSAAKLALKRIQAKSICIGADAEFALENSIRVAELPK